MPFDSSISLVGALAALAVTVVLAQVPFQQERRQLRRAWLAAWGVMALHFCFQVLQRADIGMPGTGAIADGLLVLAILLFVDWAFYLRLAAAGDESAPVSRRRRMESWLARGFALGLAIWVVIYPEWRPVAQTVCFGVLPLVGALAVLRLELGSRLTRSVLALALAIWGLAFMCAPWPWATWATLENGALVDVLTLICKVFCGLAMVLFAVDEHRALAERHRDYLNDLYQNSPLWYHSVDSQGCVTDINQVALDFLGVKAEQVMGHRIREFALPGSYEQLPSSEAVLEMLRREGKSDGIEMDFLSGDRRHTMRFFVRAVRDRSGALIGGRSVVWDVTAERQLQRQLLQSQKMQAIGTLTAGVAHDFNNLLTSVLGQAELINAKYEGQLPGDCSTRIRAIGEAGRRAADLVAQLLAFSRSQPVELAAVNLAEVVAETVGILRRGLPENVSIATSLRARPGQVQGNATQLQQVLLNLCINARQALPAGGRLLLTLEDRSDFSPPGKAAGCWAVLTVSDNGHGMTEEVRSRIFEPFFTTKERGKGTGLGLAIVYGIVQGHGGVITVESAPGQGAQFRVYLPFTPAAELAAATREADR